MLRKHQVSPTRLMTYQGETPASETMRMVIRRKPILARSPKWLQQNARRLTGKPYLSQRDHVTTKTTCRPI